MEDFTQRYYIFACILTGGWYDNAIFAVHMELSARKMGKLRLERLLRLVRFGIMTVREHRLKSASNACSLLHRTYDGISRKRQSTLRVCTLWVCCIAQQKRPLINDRQPVEQNGSQVDGKSELSSCGGIGSWDCFVAGTVTVGTAEV